MVLDHKEYHRPRPYPYPSPVFHPLQASGQFIGRIRLMQVQERKRFQESQGRPPQWLGPKLVQEDECFLKPLLQPSPPPVCDAFTQLYNAIA